METMLEQSVTAYQQSAIQTTTLQPNAWTRFINWCSGQEENRFVWLGVALTSHGCLLTPLTLAVVMMTGNNMVFFMLAMVSMAISLVTNLAALPTKITIPSYFLSIAIDVLLIVASVVAFI